MNRRDRLRLSRTCLIAAVLVGVALVSAGAGQGEVDPASAIIFDKASKFVFGTSRVIPIEAKYMDQSIHGYLATLGADSVRRVFPDFDSKDTLFTRPSGKVVKLIDLSRIYRVFFSSPIDFEGFQTGYAERDPLSATSPSYIASAEAVIPNDPYFGLQSFLTASSGSDGRISATLAWEHTTGDVTQQLGMVDTGIDGDHPEFNGRLAGGAHIGPGGGPWNTDDEVDGGHGTSVAGLMMANTNNDTGVAGVNWEASIWVADMDDIGTIGDGRFNVSWETLASAIAAAANAGSNPVNVSFGGLGSGSSELNSACYNAWISDRTVIASKGNDGVGDPHYPSDYKFVYGVGAVDVYGVRPWWSNTGNGIKVVAPGVSDYTTARNNSYRYFSGTSASAPVTSGVYSLVMAAAPSFWADEVEGILCATARDLGAAGYDDEYGYGCVDAGDAVNFVLTSDFFRMGGGHTSLTEVQGFHTRVFIRGYGGTLPTGTYLVKRYAARRYIDYSAYSFSEVPEVIIRLRDCEGWSAANPNDEFVWARIQPGTQTINGVTIETYAYDVFNVMGQHLGWWPCPHTSCGSPVTDLQVTVAGPKFPAPVLVSPPDGTRSTNGSPTLDWNNVANAEEYHVQLDNDPNFGSPNREQSGLTQSQWTVTPALSNGTYYWRARAWDQERQRWGLWSDAWEYEKYSTGGGCPVLYAYDGERFVKDNPLLTACEHSGLTEVVTDHYLVAVPVAAQDRVSFRIEEMAPEVTYLHSFDLVTVDHQQKTKVACSGDGQICTYSETIAPLSAVDHNGVDRLESLVAEDGHLFSSSEPGHLVLKFPVPAEGKLGYQIMATMKPPIIIDDPGDGGGPKVTPDRPHPSTQLAVEYLDSGGNWVPLGTIPPRDTPGQEILFQDMPLFSGDNEITLRLSWEGGYSADVVYQFVPSYEIPAVRYWSVDRCELRLGATTAKAWSGFDGSDPLVLRRGDAVQFDFAVDPLADGDLKRDYIVRAVGRYEPEGRASGELLPNRYHLYANYPNPFNPTTVVAYDLPTVTQVKLEVFNVLGQHVATLVDEEQTAGRHQAQWDSRDSQGNIVSTGIYFYRLTAGDYVNSRKMMLLK